MPYKIINTLATGVPLEGDSELDHWQRVTLGLNKLEEEGWVLVSCHNTIMIFHRPKTYRMTKEILQELKARLTLKEVPPPETKAPKTKKRNSGGYVIKIKSPDNTVSYISRRSSDKRYSLTSAKQYAKKFGSEQRAEFYIATHKLKDASVILSLI